MLVNLYWSEFVCVLSETPAPAVCGKGEFTCSSGKCISINQRCNFFNDCEDYGSDEINCNKKGEFILLCAFQVFFVKTRRLRYPECVSVLLCVSEQIRVWMNAVTTAVCVEMKVIVWWTEPTRSAPADPASRKHTCKPAQVPVQHTHTHGTGAN